MNRWMCVLILILTVPWRAFSHSGQSLWTSETYPFTKTFPVYDETRGIAFTATYHAVESAVLADLSSDLLSVTMNNDPVETRKARDEQLVGGSELIPRRLNASELNPDPPKLIIILDPILGEWPSTFTLHVGELPDIGSVINAGHYKSYAIRKYDSRYTTAYFTHVHCQGCPSHLLHVTGFVRCTYAYDCYPNHAMESVWTSPSVAFDIQYGTTCTEARCP